MRILNLLTNPRVCGAIHIAFTGVVRAFGVRRLLCT